MNMTVKKMALIGLFAALSYAAFTFLQFKIPLPGGEIPCPFIWEMQW